jgi:hypothetical protein
VGGPAAGEKRGGNAGGRHAEMEGQSYIPSYYLVVRDVEGQEG